MLPDTLATVARAMIGRLRVAVPLTIVQPHRVGPRRVSLLPLSLSVHPVATLPPWTRSCRVYRVDCCGYSTSLLWRQGCAAAAPMPETRL